MNQEGEVVGSRNEVLGVLDVGREGGIVWEREEERVDGCRGGGGGGGEERRE